MQVVPVTVIVPAYNAERWLIHAVESLFVDGQDGPDEVLIVDDASTDGTVQVADALSNRFRAVRLIRRTAQGGAAAARRDALRAARNDWAAPLDSDDRLSPGAVSEAYRTAIAHRADICIWSLMRVAGGVISVMIDTDHLSFPMSGRDATRLTLNGWAMHAQGVIRRDLWAAAHEKCAMIPSFNADELVTRELLLSAACLVSCSGAYYYHANAESSTLSGHSDDPDVVRSQTWLLEFASRNGYLAGDEALAYAMIRNALSTATRFRRHVDASLLEEIQRLLDACETAYEPSALGGVHGVASRLKIAFDVRRLKRVLRSYAAQ